MITQLIPGAWLFEPQIHADSRGLFYELMRQDEILEATGLKFDAKQINCSFSHRNVLRGIHFSNQAKYVTCVSGAVIDVVVDIKTGEHKAVTLSENYSSGVLISPGLGHAFLAVRDSFVVYACDEYYDPEKEKSIHPLDPDLGIPWPKAVFDMSDKDTNAPYWRDFEGS